MENSKCQTRDQIGENNSIGAALNAYIVVCLGFAVRNVLVQCLALASSNWWVLLDLSLWKLQDLGNSLSKK